MSQSAADAVVAARVPQQAAPADQEAAVRSGASDEIEPTWAWDDGWGMFYRIGASGVYEYSHSVDDAQTRPDGVWLSGEQVLAKRQLAETTRAEQPEPVTASGEVAQGGHGHAASGTVVTEPLDLKSALGVFERAGVPELREVLEDIEELFAELKSAGVA